MKPYQLICIVAVAALLLLEASPAEAKRRKYKSSNHEHRDHSDSNKTKTKTKWSSSTNLAGNSQVSTEEHGYYVKRTFAAQGENSLGQKRMSPPYLAIPIAWFSCDSSSQKDCKSSNSAAINSAAQSLNEGYLCDDDCDQLYEPICGRTSSEVAVFYNKCKLDVAKCRSHGLWSDFVYSECQEKYPAETAYADKKFRSSPYFRDAAIVEQLKLEEEKRKLEEEKCRMEKEKKKQEKADKKKKHKDSGESSEEKEDQKEKDEQEPLTLAIAKPVETPQISVPHPAQPAISKPIPIAESAKVSEDIVLPPMPLKDTPTPKPVEIAPLKEQTQPKSKDNDKLKYHLV
ncbi:uncharacterized protein LOC108095409 [Drosophila ficusphila]|uniref:uncharacterized protein LOC108095409 n=1 Tax=Drosophila ficusphila TaxID=30025 RepID=UPI0007E87A9D|nr:uncharacterized protein LOC108095409 [Drosophila ficusphila]